MRTLQICFCLSGTASLLNRRNLSFHRVKSTSRAAHFRYLHAVTSRNSGITMKLRKLGTSDLMVTDVCLGTMTWGIQNTEADAHDQLDYAIKERGINFIDTAEVYPVPSSAPVWVPGTTEKYIGTWLASNKNLRSKLIIATKVMGFSQASVVPGHRRDPPITEKSPSRLDRESILAACDGSLRRLQTDYIDLLQLHWPDRYVPIFGPRAYDLSKERKDSIPIRESAKALQELLTSGKIRAYGLSNETTFGVCEWCRVADELGMPRPATIQNCFSLLDRRFESHLAEACAPSNLNVGLLPWSPLAGGMLSGKYMGKLGDNASHDKSLKNARFVLFPAFQDRFCSERSAKAVSEYSKLAMSTGISLATLALAFCKSRWYVASTIIGATTLEQLKEDIDAFDVDLDKALQAKIDDVANRYLDPCVTA